MEMNTSDKWGRFIVTDEQAARIAAGDNEARDKFYFENLPLLTDMAKKYIRNKVVNRIKYYNLYCLEDMMQNLYIDLLLFDWECSRLLCFQIKCYSFFFSAFGGYWYLEKENPKVKDPDYRRLFIYSYDNILQLGNDSLTFFNVIDNGMTLEEQQECRNPYKNLGVIKKILACLFNGRALEVLILRFEGYGPAEISRKLGCKEKYIRTMLCVSFKKITLNYKFVVKALLDNGIDVERFENCIPDDYAKLVFEKNRLRVYRTAYGRALRRGASSEERISAARRAVAESGLACN